MKYIYKPKTNLERFGVKIYKLLVDNFPQTFFIGGMVRDLMLKKKVTDIDIATQATPKEIIAILNHNHISYDILNSRFGVINAKNKFFQIEITTFRKDLPSKNRYPNIKFVKNVLTDSKRRDISINSLYLSVKNNKILDFHKGLRDLQIKKIRFIGNINQKIKTDPLRIVRALRFALSLNFKLEKKSFNAIKKYFYSTSSLTQNKISSEINKIKNKKQQSKLQLVIKTPKLLDKYFKTG